MSSVRGNGYRGRGGHRNFGNNRGPLKQQAAIKQDTLPNANSMQVDEVSPSRDTSHLSSVRFDTLSGKFDQNLLASIPFSYMSLVQAATFDHILSGVDVLAQAKTGTGKTVAFLLPAIQSLLADPPKMSRPCNVSILIMSPTRELALQIEKEAKMLLNKVGDRLQVQHCIGGTNITSEQKSLQNSRCDLLVATPGRLLDHIENSGLQRQLGKVRMVVLDEADRMLDMGFRNEIRKIMSALSPRNVQPRQSLLFSATIPEGIRETADLDANCVFINTLKPGEENTHEHVPQEYLVIPSVDMFAATISLLKQSFQSNPTSGKVMLFFPTARLTGLFYSLLEMLKDQSSADDPLKHIPTFEIHSRNSQSKRVKSSEQFSKAQSGILCSSDVTARGVDFPGVTQVIQVGLPANSDQYIHRLGRTARAGASGSGILILNQAETFFLHSKEMRALSINKMDSVPNLADCKSQVTKAMMEISDQEKAQSYQASLGYYKQFTKSLGWSPATLVQEMNVFAKEGLLYERGQSRNAPPMLAKTVGKMGLKGTPGLNIVKELPNYLNEEGDAGPAQKRVMPKRALPEDAGNDRPFGKPRGGMSDTGRGGFPGRGRGGGGGGGGSRGGFQGRGRGRGGFTQRTD